MKRPRSIAAASVLALFCLLAVAVGAGPVPAQEETEAACDATADHAALTARKEAMEKSLAEKREALERLPTTGLESRAQLAKEIEALEAELVDAIYRLDCLRTDWEREPRTRSVNDGRFFAITSYYATNRRPTGQSTPRRFYGPQEAEKIQYGRVVVTIPASHRLGEIELPSLWRLEATPDPSKHFVLKELTPLENSAALSELRQAASKEGERSLLLFVHGFNVSFAEAALRTAQLSHDLAFPGVAMFMSWPASKLYTHDVESVELAKGPFNELLDDIARLPFDHVYILAHSMGTRLVSKVLAARKQSGADLSKIRDILLAAPDINAEIFKAEIAPVLAGLTNVRKTIYASSDDLALKASRAVHRFPRVGETSGGVRTFPGFDTVDCSGAGRLRRAWGHSYLFDSTSVLADLEDTMIGGKEAAKRGLKRAGVAPAIYWRLE